MNNKVFVTVAGLLFLAGAGYFFFLTYRNRTVPAVPAVITKIQPTINAKGLVTAVPTAKPIVWDTYFVLKASPQELLLSKDEKETTVSVSQTTKVYRLVGDVRKLATVQDIHEATHIQITEEQGETVIVIPSIFTNY